MSSFDAVCTVQWRGLAFLVRKFSNGMEWNEHACNNIVSHIDDIDHLINSFSPTQNSSSRGLLFYFRLHPSVYIITGFVVLFTLLQNRVLLRRIECLEIDWNEFRYKT